MTDENIEADDLGQNPTETVVDAATEKPTKKLSARQLVGLAALLSGATVTDSARRANVSRQTLSGWIHHDIDFRAALDEGRDAIRESVYGKLLASAVDAIDVLGEIMRAGDAENAQRIAAARALLAMLDGRALPEPKDKETGPQTIADLVRRIAEDAGEQILEGDVA